MLVQQWSKSVSVSIDCVDACCVEAADQLPSRHAKQHASPAAGEGGCGTIVAALASPAAKQHARQA